MRNMLYMRKFCLKLHRWLAIPFGVFISVLCFTGFILLFRDEIAELFGYDSRQMPFLIAIKQLHRWLFIVPENPHGGLSVGRILTAVSAMCMSLILITGVVIWCPKSKKMFKNRLRVNTDKGFRRFVYDTHVSLGIYAFVFLFLMSTTGPVFSFEWYKKGMSKLLGQKAENKELIIKKEDNKLISTGNHVFDTNINKHVNSQSASMQDSHQSKAGSHGNKKKKPMLFKILHTGTWAGLFSKILYAIVALIGGFLPVSGYYMWWKRNHKG